MIQIEQLSMHYGPKLLFHQANFQLNPGEKAGLLGANGSGKSTFLKILSQKEHATEGRVIYPSSVKLGVLEQDFNAYSGQKIFDVVLSGQPELHKFYYEWEQQHLAENLNDSIEDRFAQLGGYTAESQIARLLNGLGFTEEQLQHDINQFSGGYKLRVLLAKLLFSEPDVLLLDEPTNHLDLYSIRWLESYLKKYQGTLVVTSHDREFINSISNVILDVDYGIITKYKGNYNQYLRQRDERRAQTEAELSKTEKRKEELESFVTKFKAKASKARQAQSKARQIEKLEAEMEQNQLQSSSRRSPHINFKIRSKSGHTSVKVDNLSKSYGELKVLKDVSFELERGEKMAVIGPNGIGKSTLLKILVSETEANDGKVNFGHQSNFSYLPQDLEQLVQGEGSVLDWFQSNTEPKNMTDLRKTLGQLLFSGEDADKKITSLSGGERARLLLAKMIDEEANLLIFDEPTNHLDMEAIDSLINSIKSFEGSVIFVSHNRYFVSELATRVLEITPSGVNSFLGSYQDYLDKSNTDHLERGKNRKKEAKEKVKIVLTDEEKKELRKRENELRKNISQSEKKINQLEKVISDLHDKISDPSLYENGEHQKIEDLTSKSKESESQLEDVMLKWEEQSEELDQIRSSLNESS